MDSFLPYLSDIKFHIKISLYQRVIFVREIFLSRKSARKLVKITEVFHFFQVFSSSLLLSLFFSWSSQWKLGRVICSSDPHVDVSSIFDLQGIPLSPFKGSETRHAAHFGHFDGSDLPLPAVSFSIHDQQKGLDS